MNNKVNFLFFLLVFLPNNKYSSFVQILVLLFFIYLKYNQKIKSLSSDVYKIILLLSIAITFAFSGTLLGSYSLDNVVKVINIYLILVLFPISNRIKLNNKYLTISLVVIFISQISYIINLSIVVNFIEKFYSNDYFNFSEILALDGRANIGGSFRFGGLFRNPNQCGRMVTLLLGIYLINNEKIKSKDYLVISLALLSVLLTGSRTAFLISLILIFTHFISLQKNKKMARFNIILFALAVTYLAINSEFRGFDLIEVTGATSLGSKFDFLYNYYQNSTFGQFILGNFNIDEISYNYNDLRITKFDFEFGYLFHGFGILGLLIILFQVFKIFIKGDYKIKYLFIIMLWTFSSAILVNFRFSLLFFLALSFYYPHLDKNAKKTI